MTVGEASEQERSCLLPLAQEGFPYEEVIVDGHGRVKVKTQVGQIKASKWAIPEYRTQSAMHSAFRDFYAWSRPHLELSPVPDGERQRMQHNRN
jgi:hypothetical protein